MYSYIGLAMLGLFAFMVIPINVDANEDSITHYGMGTIVHLDADGNEIYQESVHNIIVDEGETFLLEQTFFDGDVGEAADGDRMGSICVTAEGSFAPTEATTASSFDAADGLVSTNCIEDTDTVDTTSTQGLAVIGPETFLAATHVPVSTVITGIGICQGITAASPFANCEAAQAAPVGELLAAIAFASSVTLNAGESLQVTYTFDARTPAS